MRNVCLVTNFNYRDFLDECLNSLISQSRKFDLIIVVDDGSTDGSKSVINEFCSNYSYATAIYKENGGQLSCFHAALDQIEPDDLVFFIDADDTYPVDYLGQVCDLAKGENADFVFVRSVQFGASAPPMKSAAIAGGAASYYKFHSTSALTRKTYCSIGAETSCLAVKGSLYLAILPYPFEKDWVTCADDVVIYAASIVGAHKLYIDSLGINYRLHGSNNCIGRKRTLGERADWRVRHERLFRWYCAKNFLSLHPPLRNVIHEAAVIPKSLRKRFGILSPITVFLFGIASCFANARILWRYLAGGKSL